MDKQGKATKRDKVIIFNDCPDAREALLKDGWEIESKPKRKRRTKAEMENG